MEDGQDTKMALENQDPQGQAGGAPPDDDGGESQKKERPFTQEQEQFLGSWMGRIVKKQLDENVLPHLRAMPAQPASMASPAPQQDALKAYNEKVQERLFSGDVLGAFQMVRDLERQTETTMTSQKKLGLMRAITGYADKPLYNEIAANMQKVADDLIAKGWPPGEAAEHAYTRCRADYYEARFAEGKESGGLGMLGGGRAMGREKKAILPTHMKTAAHRDIAAGLFKDEQEWIANLSPNLRQQYGI